MIIRETNDAFIMIKQHDHAFLSGEVAKHFQSDLLSTIHFFEDLVFAAYEHDRSWIGLDDRPIWNDQTNTPYSFSDFPLIPKLAFYKLGLDEIEKGNRYASLLCSLHYCSFFSSTSDKNSIHFLHEERRRQTNIKEHLQDLNHELLLEHFRLLQFCDDVSLYICINEPGTKKDKEHPWFRNGFTNSEIFNDGKHPFIAEWHNANEIKFKPFPFYDDFHLTVKYKTVQKSAIQVMGIAQAYENSVMEEQEIWIRK
ncbi:hypothetical protein BTR23_04240 [Alkalihalophilus pseudofirmus]|nr:hypothetical protein BTR23_04240 [Alkalihalophilus pseudofirmus]